MAKHKGKKREWTEHSLSLLYQIQEFRFPNPQLYVYTRFVNPVAFATLFDAIRIAFLDTQAGNCSFYLIEYYIKSEHSYWNLLRAYDEWKDLRYFSDIGEWIEVCAAVPQWDVLRAAG